MEFAAEPTAFYLPADPEQRKPPRIWMGCGLLIGGLMMLMVTSPLALTLVAIILAVGRDMEATREADMKRVLGEKAAANRRAAECAAEAVQLRGERDRLKATQEEELQRVLAEKAAADRRAAECAAEAVQLREELEGLSATHGT